MIVKRSGAHKGRDESMQPKPIEARHLIDIDARNRILEYESIQYLRSVREQKEHPAETDYGIIHDEANRRNREEAAKRMAERMKKAREECPESSVAQPEENPPEDEENTPAEEKGSHLDIKA